MTCADRARPTREAQVSRRSIAGTHIGPVVTNRLSGHLIFELFSGSARLSGACVSRGFAARTFDVAQSAAQDILDDVVFSGLCDVVTRRTMRVPWLAIPCATWSRARRGGCGPPALRSDRFLMGLPKLQGKDKAKVRMHNKIHYRACELVALCRLHAIDYVIENPASSRLLRTSKLDKTIDVSHVTDFDFCQFGEPWRKRTRLVISIQCSQGS